MGIGLENTRFFVTTNLTLLLAGLFLGSASARASSDAPQLDPRLATMLPARSNAAIGPQPTTAETPTPAPTNANAWPVYILDSADSAAGLSKPASASPPAAYDKDLTTYLTSLLLSELNDTHPIYLPDQGLVVLSLAAIPAQDPLSIVIAYTDALNALKVNDGYVIDDHGFAYKKIGRYDAYTVYVRRPLLEVEGYSEQSSKPEHVESQIEHYLSVIFSASSSPWTQEWGIFTDDTTYAFGPPLGSGAGGTVCPLYLTVHGKRWDFAVKVLNEQAGAQLGAKRELQVALAMNGEPGFPYCWGLFEEPSTRRAIVVTQKLAHIATADYLLASGVDLETAAAELLAATAALHRKGFAHRDLKPANLMLDHHGRVHIIDYDRATDEASALPDLGVWGTKGYLAPERHQSSAGHNYQISHPINYQTADWFAIGAILFEWKYKSALWPYMSQRYDIGKRVLMSGKSSDFFRKRYPGEEAAWFASAEAYQERFIGAHVQQTLAASNDPIDMLIAGFLMSNPQERAAWASKSLARLLAPSNDI